MTELRTAAIAERPVRTLAACPACGGAKFDLLSEWAGSFDGGPEAGRLPHPAYRIQRCAACGLYCKSHTPDPAQLDNYYGQLDASPFDYAKQLPIDRKVLEILSRLPEGATILDFGCSTGRLLSWLRGSHRLFGVEPNAEAALVAAQRGIRIVSESELRAQGLEFDLILMTDVYEHLVDPMATFDLLRSRLKPGGAIVLVTGYADAIVDRQWMGEYWYFRLYGHLHMLGSRHLDWLCASRKLELAERHVLCHYHRGLAALLMQQVRVLAYSVLVKHRWPGLLPIFSRIPILKRARSWTNMPPTYLSKDHVVAVLKRPGSEFR